MAANSIGEQYVEVMKACKQLAGAATASAITKEVGKNGSLRIPIQGVCYSANQGWLENTHIKGPDGKSVYKVTAAGNAILKNLNDYCVIPYKINKRKAYEKPSTTKAAETETTTALPENISANTAQFVDGLSALLHENMALREAMEKTVAQLAGYLDCVVIKRAEFEAIKAKLNNQ